MERKHRGCSEKLIVTGETTEKPPDWKTFLANEENKKQLIELLCRVWILTTISNSLAQMSLKLGDKSFR
jgi:hypothetical protein